MTAQEEKEIFPPTSRHPRRLGVGVGAVQEDSGENVFRFKRVQDLMQLPLFRSPSLLSVGAKSHVSTASGCVDSFTNRNVKRHTQGGPGDKGGAARGRKRSKHGSVRQRKPCQKHLNASFFFFLITQGVLQCYLQLRVDNESRAHWPSAEGMRCKKIKGNDGQLAKIWTGTLYEPLMKFF